MKSRSSIKTIIDVCRLEPFSSATAVFLIMIATILEVLSVGLLLPVLALGQEDKESSSFLESTINTFVEFFGLQPDIKSLLTLIVVLIVLKAIIVFFVNRHIRVIIIRFGTSRRLEFVSALAAANWDYFAGQSVGKAINTAVGEVAVAMRCMAGVLNFLARLIQLPIYILGAAMVDFIPAIAGLCAGIFLYLIFSFFVVRLRKAGEQAQDASAKMSSFLSDLLIGIKPIKAMARESLITPLVIKEIKSFNRHLEYQATLKSGGDSLREPIFVLFMIPFLYFSLVLQPMPLAEILAIVFLFYRLVSNFAISQSLYQDIAGTEAYFYSALEKINEAKVVKEELSEGRNIKRFDQIRVDNVHLALSSKEVIKGLSCSFDAGTITVLKGESGSGKTTLSDLLISLREPERGSIFIDGTNLSDISKSSWRNLIGYMPQEAFLLHNTISFNVTLNDNSLKKDEIVESLRLAEALDFVNDLSYGIETNVGERGNRLSGGERQRIMIARALVKKPSLLILDEPTSGLDGETEKGICDTLNKLRGLMTIIIVTHQEGPTRIADNVYYISDGKIVDK